ncbi:MAG: PDDEXK nuclease domain-containing protein [Synergistaceae bacterium]|nr:PDDEXK nuclease domain-containing protein [Synergistaceae bacterium]
MTYHDLLKNIKVRIRHAQRAAISSANAEMLALYWDVGRMIDERQASEGWGSGVIPRLAKDIRNDISEIKGFPERNLKRMLAFYREYRELIIVPSTMAQLTDVREDVLQDQIVPSTVAQLNNPPRNSILRTSWTNNIFLMEKVKDIKARSWYMEQVLIQGWTGDDLASMIKNDAYSRQGKAITNFAANLPSHQSDIAAGELKDPYIFDFLTLSEPFQEKELESELIKHLEKFLIELGSGFAFVGRQFHLEISDQDYYIDLLFYHLKLRSFVVIELKKGAFKPEYAGKLNFYCSVVDDLLRHETDNATIGLILCQTKDKVLAEYALRDIRKPIGVSEYELTRALPDDLKSSLPSIEDIEQALELSTEEGFIFP